MRAGLAHVDLDSIVWEPGKIAVQRPDELSQLPFEASSIRTLRGSLKAATANWFERRRVIACCWCSSTRGSMRASQTISNALGAAQVRFARTSKHHA